MITCEDIMLLGGRRVASVYSWREGRLGKPRELWVNYWYPSAS